MKTVYGPVPSWRLGRSLGVDPVCAERKTCSFDCIYCQLGKTLVKTSKRREFISAERLEKDLREALQRAKADVVTFSGTAEPTLASNLGELVDVVRKLTGLPVAILTNSSLMGMPEVAKDLSKFDIVVAKLDAPSEALFKKIDQPLPGTTLKGVVAAIKDFKRAFKGRLDLQMMFTEENKGYAKEMADLARGIGPDAVELNTPLRPCAVKPLGPAEMAEIAKRFKGLNAISVYGGKRPKVNVDDIAEVHLRRPALYSG